MTRKQARMMRAVSTVLSVIPAVMPAALSWLLACSAPPDTVGQRGARPGEPGADTAASGEVDPGGADTGTGGVTGTGGATGTGGGTGTGTGSGTGTGGDTDTGGGTAGPDCSDTLSGSAPVAGPQGLMIQVHTSTDTCALERALEHVCAAHRSGDGALHDLVLTDVVTAGADGRPTEELNTEVLDLVMRYRGCWDNLFFGTLPDVYLDDPYDESTVGSESARWEWLWAAQRVGAALADYLGTHMPGEPWHGYVSYEANLGYMADASYRAAYEALLLQHTRDLDAINPGMAVAWSPTFWDDPDALSSTQLAAVEAGVAELLSGVPGISWLLIQDHLGVDSSLTCDDALEWLALVQRAGPSLASVQLNVEYFTLEDGVIQAGDPSEISARIACYQDGGASLGASFEWRYWYGAHGH